MMKEHLEDGAMKKQKSRVYFDRKAGRVRTTGGSTGRRTPRFGAPSEGRWEAGSGQSFEDFVKKWESRFSG